MLYHLGKNAQGGSFGPQQVQAMTTALDEAWQLRSLQQRGTSSDGGVLRMRRLPPTIPVAAPLPASPRRPTVIVTRAPRESANRLFNNEVRNDVTRALPPSHFS